MLNNSKSFAVVASIYAFIVAPLSFLFIFLE